MSTSPVLADDEDDEVEFSALSSCVTAAWSAAMMSAAAFAA